MAPMQPLGTAKLFLIVSGITALLVLSLVVWFYTGYLFRKETTNATANEIGYAYDLVLLFLSTPFFLVIWFVLLIQLLRERRSGHISPEPEK